MAQWAKADDLNLILRTHEKGHIQWFVSAIPAFLWRGRDKRISQKLTNAAKQQKQKRPCLKIKVEEPRTNSQNSL